MDMKTLKALRNLDSDDLLGALGLQRSSSADWVAPALTALGVGILVGAGLGLMLAPKSGQELRQDLRERLNGEEEDAATKIKAAAGTAEQRLRST